jgi:hypothetical protein
MVDDWVSWLLKSSGSSSISPRFGFICASVPCELLRESLGAASTVVSGSAEHSLFSNPTASNKKMTTKKNLRQLARFITPSLLHYIF